MTEKKFCIPAMVISLLSAVLAFFMMPVEAIAAGIIGVVLSLVKREKCRIKLPVILAVLGILGGGVILAHMIIQGRTGLWATDYWFFELMFGKFEG